MMAMKTEILQFFELANLEQKKKNAVFKRFIKGVIVWYKRNISEPQRAEQFIV